MNDITKARYFLHAKGSDLQYMVSFGLMLATAEQRYRDILLRKQGNKDVEGTWDAREVDAIVEVSVLRYLKRTNQLPRNVAEAFKQGVTLERKKELAQSWLNGQ